MIQRSTSNSFGLVGSTLAWLLLSSVLVALRVLLPPAIIEQVYSTNIYLGVRQVLDSLFGWWPFPASALVVVLGVILIVRSAWRASTAKSPQALSSRQRAWFAGMGRVGLSLLRSSAIIVTAFLVLWGFNYGRPGISDHLNLNGRPLSDQELWHELHATANYVEILRTQLPLSDTNDTESLPLPQINEVRIRESLQRQLQLLDYPAEGRVRTRYVFPGTLLRFNTSGIYFPLTGEAHVDEGLHTLQLPFVIAHELAHGYGITDEGACNFIAWLACTRAHNLYLRYAGHLTYLRYVGAALRRRDAEEYSAFRQNLPPGVKADLNSIAKNLDRFDEIMPSVRDAVYDSYLRGQGVQDGLASYSRVIDLVVAWQNAQQEPRAVRTKARLPLQ